MSVLQLSSVLLLTFISCAFGKDLIYYQTIKYLSSTTFFGQDVKNTNLLDMRNCGIDNVSSTAFSGMSNLKFLVLVQNNINTLPENVFDSLEENLHTIFLESNKLDRIPNKLFAKLPKLKDLSISHNELSKLEHGTFDNNNEIQRIYLQHNRLRTIPARLFSKLKKLIHLNIAYNLIFYIDDNALPNDNLQELYVFGNKLQYINEKHVNNLKTFSLDANPWFCNCRMKQIHAKWKRNFQSQGWTPHCALPKEKMNMRWATLSSDDFKCTNVVLTLHPEAFEIPVHIGQSVTISCNIKGTASLENVIFTYGNNTEVTNQLNKNGHPFNIQSGNGVGNLWYNLTILNVRKTDEETYKCVVKNEKEVEVKLRVKEVFLKTFY